ncbi:MAG: hypothetical protein KME15_16415 [Drouetiella hepatica Uher 2000/2452]|jgi:hypothetical protein|uniref:Uncharacterized protein n=1 Tax=Drouetiella hepatica Uher 2000/2452 TaxID=904376 RepID=A0A951UNA0_9CYAN|nr:hypothetical protein [Drouetiella hepatica Uher 2000/2452]
MSNDKVYKLAIKAFVRKCSQVPKRLWTSQARFAFLHISPFIEDINYYFSDFSHLLTNLEVSFLGHLLGCHYEDYDRDDDAVHYLKKGLSLLQKNEPFYLQSFNHLSTKLIGLYFAREHNEEAKQLCTQGIRIYVKGGLKNSIQYLVCLSYLGLYYKIRKKYYTARKILSLAILHLKHISPSEDIPTLGLIRANAYLFLAQLDTDEDLSYRQVLNNFSDALNELKKVEPEVTQPELMEVFNKTYEIYQHLDLPFGNDQERMVCFQFGKFLIRKMRFSAAVNYLAKSYRLFYIYAPKPPSILFEHFDQLKISALMADRYGMFFFAEAQELSIRKELDYYDDLRRMYGFENPFTEGLIAQYKGDLDIAKAYYEEAYKRITEGVDTEYGGFPYFYTLFGRLLYDLASRETKKLQTADTLQIYEILYEIEMLYFYSASYFETAIRTLLYYIHPDFTIAVMRLSTLRFLKENATPIAYNLKRALREYSHLYAAVTRFRETTLYESFRTNSLNNRLKDLNKKSIEYKFDYAEYLTEFFAALKSNDFDENDLDTDLQSHVFDEIDRDKLSIE